MIDNLNYTRLLPDPLMLPPDMVKLPRWIAWNLTSDGKKLPKQRVNDPQSWLTLDEALANPGTGGIGFVFTADDDLGGVDLDSCRNPETGELDPWAQQILSMFDSYAEISPSKTGVKIFAKGAPPKLASHVIPINEGHSYGEKKPQLEAYVTGRFFAVTGEVLPGTEPGMPLDVRPHAWLRVADMLSALSVTVSSRSRRENATEAECTENGEKKPKEKITRGSRNTSLIKMAGLMRRQGFGMEAIAGALLTHNKDECNPPLTDEEVWGIARSVTRYTPMDDAGSPFSGKIPPNSQHHLTLAFDRLDISFSYDKFNDHPLITYPASLFDGGGEEPVTKIYDDGFLRRIYFMLERDFFIKTSIHILEHFILDRCQDRIFHPVVDYFNTLKWDGTLRIDDWLETYLHAKPKDDREKKYLRAVGVATLLGAVRRIKRPGCKFDSMMVLEGLTNAGKSMSVQALSPNEEWVLEDLSLGTDAKIVIERTEGKWLCEVSELVASRRSEINRIKAFLSLKSDVARKAYGRQTTKRPRSFVFLGTTNEIHYLEDKTGNRRYWPVRCGDIINFNELAKDRDQLWAEALLREPGAELYLTGELFEIAKEQQAMREAVDDWETFVHGIIGNKPGWIMAQTIWRRLGRPLGQISTSDSRRMGGIFTRLGFHSMVRYMKGRGEGSRVWLRWSQGNSDPSFEKALLDEDNHWELGEEVPVLIGKEAEFF